MNRKSKTSKSTRPGKLQFKPVTAREWPDVVTLFGDRGACGGCWCMAWRLSKQDYERNKGAGNKRRLKKLVDDGEVPGILAYSDGKPVGWCSFGPRETFTRLDKSRVLKPIDDQPVWSISCLFITKSFRRQGVSSELLRAVATFAAKKGVRILEGYPVLPYTAKMPDVFAWTGLPGSFERAGFVEAARPSKSRPIMRLEISGKKK